MPTRLLRIVYPPAVAADIEPETGRAGNDECYVTEVSSPTTTIPVEVIAATARDDGENDDYYLGGYAGI
jgi:hypothetical protein